jgi:hypothetical protein
MFNDTFAATVVATYLCIDPIRKASMSRVSTGVP